MITEMITGMALEGGKKVAATFGTKLGTAMVGAVAGHAVNNAINKKIAKKVAAGEEEPHDPKKVFYRSATIDSIGAAAGAVGFSIINDAWISK